VGWKQCWFPETGSEKRPFPTPASVFGNGGCIWKRPAGSGAGFWKWEVRKMEGII